MSRQPGLFDEPEAPPAPPGPFAMDEAARAFAVDPRHNVVLEASAGTGKTTVLVQRYLNLLAAGVDPANILAITFTRKAAAEMRDRILAALRRAAQENEEGRRRWLKLRDRVSDIAISTIDAFCYSLLREFPLEAGLDPGFTVADETETARLAEEAIDRALRACRKIAEEDETVALVLARLTPKRLREGLAHLVDRRLVAPAGLRRYLRQAPTDLDVAAMCRKATERLREAIRSAPEGLAAFIADGPRDNPRFALLEADLRALDAGTIDSAETLWAVAGSLRSYFLTEKGEARKAPVRWVSRNEARSADAWKRHVQAMKAVAPAVHAALAAWARDLNVLLARGIARIFAITREQHRRTLAEHEVVDFPELLERAVELLRQMDEFSQSRYRLESRYHHVLVDEFQDTSRLQWELVALLVKSWGEGFGLVHEAPLLPSLFVVGDRKQSIYRFRDADVTLLDEAAETVARLRPEGGPRRYISRSFRSFPSLLAFVNDVCAEVAEDSPDRADAFSYREPDHFPIEGEHGAGAAMERGPDQAETVVSAAALRDVPLRLVVGEDIEGTARRVAAEIARLLGSATVRDRTTGIPRAAEPGDIAILFRSRESHREFERALETYGIPAYVYKGLGFFDSDEIKDLLALIRFLADPASNLRAAALLRSRFVRLSDAGLRQLAPDLARAVTRDDAAEMLAALSDRDRATLERIRGSVARWLTLVDRLPPAELIDHVLAASAYELELIGPRHAQARENVKKLRALVRRIENRGYATLPRLAEHIDRLSTGDEANAVLEAVEAVNLMTVHASKGLEFPIVFLVNLGRGVARRRPVVRVQLSGDEEEGSASVGIEAFRSDADEIEPVLDREETKRLLYVALTRARDALYLSATLKDGEFKPVHGGLGHVLPSSLQKLLTQAGQVGDGTLLSWEGRSRRHRCLVAVPPEPASPRSAATAAVDVPAFERPALDPLEPGVPRVSVTASDVDSGQTELQVDTTDEAEREARRLAGRLVHRLLRRHPPGTPVDDHELRRSAARAVRPDETSAVHLSVSLDIAVSLYRRLANRAELRELFNDGAAEWEVPCSRLVDGRVERGTLDLLVRRRDGSVVVVEIKTGAPRPGHQRQLDAYVTMVQSVMTGGRATGLLVYA
ncbi:MAG TPA: UvrD-helicase domain-containing protein [Vicinamibacterales bacterium]